METAQHNLLLRPAQVCSFSSQVLSNSQWLLIMLRVVLRALTFSSFDEEASRSRFHRRKRRPVNRHNLLRRYLKPAGQKTWAAYDRGFRSFRTMHSSLMGKVGVRPEVTNGWPRISVQLRYVLRVRKDGLWAPKRHLGQALRILIFRVRDQGSEVRILSPQP